MRNVYISVCVYLDACVRAYVCTRAFVAYRLWAQVRVCICMCTGMCGVSCCSCECVYTCDRCGKYMCVWVCLCTCRGVNAIASLCMCVCVRVSSSHSSAAMYLYVRIHAHMYVHACAHVHVGFWQLCICVLVYVYVAVYVTVHVYGYDCDSCVKCCRNLDCLAFPKGCFRLPSRFNIGLHIGRASETQTCRYELLTILCYALERLCRRMCNVNEITSHWPRLVHQWRWNREAFRMQGRKDTLNKGRFVLWSWNLFCGR